MIFSPKNVELEWCQKILGWGWHLTSISVSLPVPRVTWAFLEIVNFLKWKCGKKSKILWKSENYSYNEIQFIVFLLQNVFDQIFEISTIVENLVTLPVPKLKRIAAAVMVSHYSSSGLQSIVQNIEVTFSYRYKSIPMLNYHRKLPNMPLNPIPSASLFIFLIMKTKHKQ